MLGSAIDVSGFHHDSRADIMETLSSSPELAMLLAKLERGERLESHEDIQIDFLVARVCGIFAAVQAAADSGVVGEGYLEDSNIGLNVFASRFRLNDRMWRYIRRAHSSVKDGRVFGKLRSAAESTDS